MNIYIVVSIILILKILFKNKEKFHSYFKDNILFIKNRRHVPKDGYVNPYYNYPSYSNYFNHPYYNYNNYHKQYYPYQVSLFDD